MRKLLLLTFILFSCAKREAPVTSAPSTAKPQSTTTQTQTATTQPAPSAGGQTADVGTTLPPYTAQMIDGKTFDVAAERGNVLFINLWATWCGPCRFEIPELQSMHNKYASRRFKVVGVSLDDTGIDGVKEFVAKNSMTYPIAYDPDGKIAAILQSSVLPTSVIVDRTGHVVWKKYGAVSMSDPTLNEALTRALDAPKS
jgi:thiol-disulfide isomerase/thioredoxin